MADGSLLPLFGVWGAGSLVVLALIRASWLRDRQARSAAKVLGLTFEDGPRGERLTGRVDGLEVEATWNSRGVRVEVRGVSPDLVVRARREGEGPGWLRTGDAHFDALVHVDGDRSAALALLDASARRALEKQAARGELRVEAGMVIVDADGGVEPGLRKTASRRRRQPIVRVIRNALAAASYVTRPEEGVEALLARNALDEESATVRLRNLLCLLEEHASSKAAARAVRAALEDTDAAVRLCAAWGADAERAVAVARAVLVGSAPAGVRKQAVALLSERLPHDEAIAAGMEALADREPRVRAEAIRRLAWLGAKNAAKAIASCRTSRDREERLAVVRALTRFGGPEAALAELVQDPDDYDVRTEAARALARVGTVASIEALHAGARGLLTPAAVKSECQNAIAAIQARAEGAGAGQLALAEPLGVGDVSLLEGHGGEMALVAGEEDTRPRPRAAKTTA